MALTLGLVVCYYREKAIIDQIELDNPKKTNNFIVKLSRYFSKRTR